MACIDVTFKLNTEYISLSLMLPNWIRMVPCSRFYLSFPLSSSAYPGESMDTIFNLTRPLHIPLHFIVHILFHIRLNLCRPNVAL